MKLGGCDCGYTPTRGSQYRQSHLFGDRNIYDSPLRQSVNESQRLLLLKTATGTFLEEGYGLLKVSALVQKLAVVLASCEARDMKCMRQCLPAHSLLLPPSTSESREQLSAARI